MHIEIKTWLYDILNAINEIDSFLLIPRKNLLHIKMIWKPGELLKETMKSYAKQWTACCKETRPFNFPIQEK